MLIVSFPDPPTKGLETRLVRAMMSNLDCFLYLPLYTSLLVTPLQSSSRSVHVTLTITDSIRLRVYCIHAYHGLTLDYKYA